MVSAKAFENNILIRRVYAYLYIFKYLVVYTVKSLSDRPGTVQNEHCKSSSKVFSAMLDLILYIIQYFNSHVVCYEINNCLEIKRDKTQCKYCKNNFYVKKTFF